MLRKDFDGYLEFIEKLEKADKEETGRLCAERVQLWVNKLQKILEVMPSGDAVFAITALHMIKESAEKDNPKATAMSRTLLDSLGYETESGTIPDATEAAARAYAEAMKNK